MPAAALLLLIEIAGPALPADDRADRCPGADTGIVVCGRKAAPERYRIPSSSGVPDDDPGIPQAETGLFGATRIGITTEQSSLGGVPSNRVMMRLRVPFGRSTRR